MLDSRLSTALGRKAAPAAKERQQAALYTFIIIHRTFAASHEIMIRLFLISVYRRPAELVVTSEEGAGDES